MLNAPVWQKRFSQRPPEAALRLRLDFDLVADRGDLLGLALLALHLSAEPAAVLLVRRPYDVAVPPDRPHHSLEPAHLKILMSLILKSNSSSPISTRPWMVIVSVFSVMRRRMHSKPIFSCPG